MRNSYFPLSAEKIPLKLWGLLLLILALFLTACSNHDKNLVQGVAGPDLTVLDRPEAVALHFLAVCQDGDWATALDLLVLETKEAVLSWGGGNPCSKVSTGAASAALIANERVGNTTYITFNWPAQDSDAIVEYQLLLTEIEGTWLIFDDHKKRQQPSTVPITPAPTVALPNIVSTRTTESGK